MKCDFDAFDRFHQGGWLTSWARVFTTTVVGLTLSEFLPLHKLRGPVHNSEWLHTQEAIEIRIHQLVYLTDLMKLLAHFQSI